MDSRAVDHLIHQIYEGAFDDGAWQNTIDAFNSQIFNSAVAFDHNTTVGGADPCISSADIDLAIRDQAVHHFNTPELNPGIAAVMSAKIGRPFLLESFVDARMLEEHDAVRFFFEPHKFDKGLFVAIDRSDTGFTFMSLFREKQHLNYNAQDITLLAKLSPHISKAFRLRDLRRSAERREVVLRQLDQSDNAPAGVVIVDSGLRIIEADVITSARLEKADGLCRHGRQIASTSKHAGRDTKSLHDFIQRGGLDAPAFLIDCNDAALLRLRVVPVAPGMLARAGSGSKAIVIDVIRRAAPIDFRSFAAAYDLTPAERRFIEALVKAKSATQAAENSGISRNTAKTHLSHIFHKTGVNSQTQLMLLLGRFS